MTLVALTHGYPPAWNMGGEVSLHRTLVAAGAPVEVLTRTDSHYVLDGVNVKPIATDDALNIHADPAPIIDQLRQLGATAVLVQNELSWPAVRAARELHIPCIVSVHTPPRYGRGIAEAVRLADHRIYNTHAAAREWQRPGIVLHPPISPLPPAPVNSPEGDAYTLLSNLANKGVTVALDLAARMPNQRFIIVRSPAEPTHGLENFDALAASLPNVEVCPRVEPHEVSETYLSQTRILLVPSRYETYGMSTLEAAGYGIPTVHVDTPHVREGIGEAAELVPPLNTDATLAAIQRIEADYLDRSVLARARAVWIDARQTMELKKWATFLTTL